MTHYTILSLLAGLYYYYILKPADAGLSQLG